MQKGQVGAYEERDKMLCKHPYMRKMPYKRAHMYLSEENRVAATPFPCGRCLPCRINKARIWTHRVLLESMVHDMNSFITLTYNNDNIPEDGNLKKEDLQKFFKRLRKKLQKLDLKIRYFACGEYGEEKGRPHYHALIFGIDEKFVEYIKEAWKDKKKKEIGNVFVGTLTKDSARYCTGYVMKNQTKEGDLRLNGKKPEFMTCSRRPAIGKRAVEKVALQLKKHGVNKVVREFQFGKKKMPLGRLLTEYTSELLELSDEVKEKELYEYQEGLFQLLDDKYVVRLIDMDKQKRLSQEKRFKMFSRREKI